MASFTVKLNDVTDKEIIALVRASGNANATLREALYHFYNFPPPKPSSSDNATPPFDPQLIVNAIHDGLRDIAPDLGKAIGKAVAKQLEGLTIPIYTNEQEEPVEDDDDPELANATANFLNAFG